MSNISYRPDIDGLRALAVVPVVLFHAAVPGFSGGFVGVDVFFVISGFLITQIITREIDEGSFSLAGFYVRRIRRIVPALIAMLTVTLGVGWFILLPDDYETLGKTTGAALASVSNIIFYLQSGYFDDDALVKPLLHTWSLAVEEQFYLYLPLLLLAIKVARPSSRLPVVSLLALGSLVLAAVTVPDGQSYAFYRLPPRAWELLAGSLLALGAVPRIADPKMREGLAALGVGFIVAAVLFYSEDILFPGLSALPPVAGAGLVIHCAPGTRTGRLLGLGLPRGIGQISYSLYLWHWPVIVFFSYYHQAPLSPFRSLVVIALSTVLAILSWRFVEQPFRRAGTGRQWRVFAVAATAMGALGAVSVSVVQSAGLPNRFPPEIARFSKEAAISPVRSTCHARTENTPEPEKACRLGDTTRAPSVAVWGDSHGVELAYALGELGSREGFSLLELTASSCPPSIARTEVRGRQACIAHNRSVLRFLTENSQVETVVMAAFFGRNFRQPKNNYGPGMLETIAALRKAGKEVIMVGPMPKQNFDVPRKLMLAAALGSFQAQGRTTSSFIKGNRKTFRLLDQAREAGAKVVLPHRLFCDKKRCAVERDGKMLYFDDDHPSLDAARFIAREVKAAMKTDGAPQTSFLERAPALNP